MKKKMFGVCTWNIPEASKEPTKFMSSKLEFSNWKDETNQFSEYYVCGDVANRAIPPFFFFQCARTHAARKLGNPRLMNIMFNTLRHWKGTVEYHKTKDILHVKEVLGHRNINNTLVYINLEKAIFNTSNDEFTVRAVDNIQEACKLLEVGFEYVAEVQGKKLFRKRK